MVKVYWKTIFSVFFLISALLFTSNARKFQENTSFVHLGHSTADLCTDEPRGPFADLYDSDIWDNTTFTAVAEPDFSYWARSSLRELIHKSYNALWYPLVMVFVILIPLAVDHLTNYCRKKEQIYLMFIMFTPLVYGVLVFWGVSHHLAESTVNLDVIIPAIIQLYMGMVLIWYFWFLISCSHSIQANIAFFTHHHFHSLDLRFLLPRQVVFTQQRVKRVSRMLYLYIPLRIIALLFCILVVPFVPHEWHFSVELLIDFLLLVYELLAHYWVDLVYESILHHLPSPILHKMSSYLLALGFVSSLQEWILKLICIFFYLCGIQGFFMIADVPFVQYIVLMGETVPLAIAVYGRFTASAYLSFVLDVACPQWHLNGDLLHI